MSILKFAPAFSPDEVEQFANEFYALNGSVEQLPSERDQNFLITGKSGKRYVLKIANAMEDVAVLEAQNQAMERVSEYEGLFPFVLTSMNDNKIEIIKSVDGQEYLVRVLTYLDGTPMGTVKHHSSKLMIDLGYKLGMLDDSLQSFDHSALHRDLQWDFANGSNIIKTNAKLIDDRKLQDLVHSFQKNFEKVTLPLLSRLRKSVIYNDANNYNILLGSGDDIFSKDQSVTGFIDLGDMLYSYTVSDLAIAIAYAILDKPQPLATAAEIVKGYHSVFPLTEDEISVLFDLVTMRMCMSACIAAEQQKNQPDNEYLGVSQLPIRNTLPKWMDIHPRFAEAVFRNACGLAPFVSSTQTVNWLRKNTFSFAPILPVDSSSILDLSISSPLLHGDVNGNTEPKLTCRINEQLEKAGAKVGIGQYNEARYIYTSPAFKTGDGPTDETRTVHLGIDLFVDPGTPVRAPLDGMVVAFADNATPQDYGPVIILEHKMDDGEKFYTLYGQLSRESLSDLKVGKKIRKGEEFAEIGSAEVNGGWTPHLHFQVVVDLLELGCDFPGVAQPSQRAIWLSLCPDPNLMLGIPNDVFPERAPTKAETLSARRERLGRNLSIAYNSPLKIVRGWMQYLYDEEGRKYIDAYNNVAHVGHCHPK
ncbi:MAG TPA: peptidoglycan DD-metalloendopeptidase family protein, partial [Anaerolineales bacterium]|nr:peptidoglycan DD-metalloendopeptidase family protein [Anaerolineales bacterium]